MINSLTQPKIKVKQIEISPYVKSDNQAVNDYWIKQYAPQINNIGKNPLVWYNGIHISEESIVSFYLNSDNFFPILQMYFTDDTSQMISNAFAQDDTIISIFIDSRVKDSGNAMVLKPIRMDFKLTDYSFNEEDKTYYIQGIPDIDDLYIQNIKTYKDKTSFETLKQVASELKLGFNSNVTNTSDKMNWLNMNLENYQFIKDVTKKSYKDDKSFFTSFIDYYYCLNHINVEQSLQESLDVKGVLTYGDEGIDEANSQLVTDLYIMSGKDMTTRYNNLYETYEILNKSTKISVKNGYRTNIHYYDRTGNWKERAGTFVRFNLETNTDGRGIIMKGKVDDTTGFYKKNVKSVYMPILDVDNVHKNYNFASVLNEKNLEELDKVSIKVTMRTPNFNFYKYQKIRLFIMNVNIASEIVNKRLSGGWLIKSINYYYGLDANLTQELIMVKRELSVEDFDF